MSSDDALAALAAQLSDGDTFLAALGKPGDPKPADASLTFKTPGK